jgi:hypothetical protein
LQDGARPAPDRHANQSQLEKPSWRQLPRVDCRSLTWRSRQASLDKPAVFGRTADYLV